MGEKAKLKERIIRVLWKYEEAISDGFGYYNDPPDKILDEIAEEIVTVINKKGGK